ncbi:MAG: metallophosphoesterase [candidate division Zixibacteria bacterium]|nr:metallophosphoesterase [candidate division Zixibacteria bacterium]
MKAALRTIGIIVCCLMISAVVASTTEIGTLVENPVRFAILGDRTGGHVEGIYGKVVDEIEPLQPEFVITVGDMIEGYETDTTICNEQWEEYLKIVRPLSMPIYYTPGNHDITYDVAEGPYRRYIGKPYYAFDHRGLHIIVMDNSRWESSDELPSEQLTWLIDDLKTNRNAPRTLVFMHKPFWYNSTAIGKPDTLHSLFADFGVDAVFTGHFHHYFSGEFDGIRYTGIGSSGAGTHLGDNVLGYHFGWVTVDGDGMTIAPISMGGVHPWDLITVADAYFMSRLERCAITFDRPIPVDAELKVLSSELTVTVANLSDKVTLHDTLQWDLPDNWKIDPMSTPVEIAPGAKRTITFELMQRGDLYPLPSVSARIPYKPGQAHQVNRDLHVARQAICVAAVKKPAIDGKLDESCWLEAETLLLDDDGVPADGDSTRFYFAYDDKAVYLAAICYESVMDSLTASVKEHDGPVYSEDCVGYFIQPDLAGEVIYQIYVNPAGAVFDQKLAPKEDEYYAGDRSWNTEPEIATDRGVDFWTVEIKIPLTQLQVKTAADSEWGLNFRRKQKRLNHVMNWQSPIDYDPATYGRLSFE